MHEQDTDTKEVIDLGAASEETRGIPKWMHEESIGEMDYRD